MATVLDLVTGSGVSTTYTPFPTPASLEYTKSEMDASSSGRNQAGLMFRDVVASKVKLQVAWGKLDESQCSTILNMVDAPFFRIRYPDAYTGAKRTMECYVGDRQAPMYRMDTDGVWHWEGLSFSFIER